jgi:hypothetical protein
VVSGPDSGHAEGVESTPRCARGRSVGTVISFLLAAGLGLAGCDGGAAPNDPSAAGPTATASEASASAHDSPSVTGSPSAQGTPSGTPSTPRPSVPSKTPQPTTTPAPASLRLGAQGPEVVALQRRLLELGYWLGEADGSFGASTRHAVLAFQKYQRLGRDGVVGPTTARALVSASRPKPRSTSGRVVEVDLPRQLLVLAVDGRVQWVFDASTGAQAGTTPTGRYRVFRHVDDYDTGPLGTLYRPKYFNGGVAVHGFPSVPAYPASHGCVRVTNVAMDWLWSNGTLRIGQPIWVY